MQPTAVRLTMVSSVLRLLAACATLLAPPRGAECSKDKGMISQGVLFDPETYPYVVGLEIRASRRRTSTCSGSLIAPLYVLTAAHCTVGRRARDFKVHRRSMYSSDYRSVYSIHQHEKYEKNKLTADISLLKMLRPFKDIGLYAKLSGHPSDFANNTALECTVIGFGVIDNHNTMGYSGYMTTVSVKYGPDACEAPPIEVRDTNQEFLCSKPSVHSICPGDSGGPMICNGSLYGIGSHGYNMKNDSEFVCGSPDVQTRHLFVYVYMDWIYSVQNFGSTSAPVFGSVAAIVVCGAFAMRDRYHPEL